MLNLSFYLLTQNAKNHTQVYVSISRKLGVDNKRLRFATGESFIASYCHIRKKKNGKELVKRNTAFYFEYTDTLNTIRNNLIRIAMDLDKDDKNFSLDQVKQTYYTQTGRIKDENNLTFDEAYSRFLTSSQGGWTEGTQKHFTTLNNHLKKFEKITGEITLGKVDEDFWNNLRDNYFVKVKKFSNNSTNANLKKFKQFLMFADKKKLLKQRIDFDQLKFLDEIEPFKISLKEIEVKKLMSLDLSASPRLDRVRDLFLLEIMCGQRYSDIEKVLDRKHILDDGIQIYQQKTNERVIIPLHSDLKKQIKFIFKKYPDKLPSVINQKFNESLKELCELAGFKREHSWVKLVGKEKIKETDFRFNLVSTHTGRRTFCVQWLKNGQNPEWIMKVCGWRSYDQFKDYVKVDDEDITESFKGKMYSNTRKQKQSSTIK